MHNEKKTFSLVLINLREVIDKLISLNPGFFAITFALILLTIFIIIKSIDLNLVYVFFIALLFTLASFMAFLRNGSLTETTIVFSTGIFTAFSIQWDAPRFSIFFGFYIILILLIFFKSGLKIASEIETLMIKAQDAYLPIKEYSIAEVQAGWNNFESIKFKSLITLETRKKIFLRLTNSKIPIETIPDIFQTIIDLIVTRDADVEKLAESICLIFRENKLRPHLSDFHTRLESFKKSLLSSYRTANQFLDKFLEQSDVFLSYRDNFDSIVAKCTG